MNTPASDSDAQGAVERVGSVSDDPYNDPDYQAWAEALAKECTCSGDRPCDGLLAGGFCDNLQLNDGWDDDDRY